MHAVAATCLKTKYKCTSTVNYGKRNAIKKAKAELVGESGL